MSRLYCSLFDETGTHNIHPHNATPDLGAVCHLSSQKNWAGLKGNSFVPSHGCKTFLLHTPECDSGKCFFWRLWRVHSHLFLLIYKTWIPTLLSVKGCKTNCTWNTSTLNDIFIAFHSKIKCSLRKWEQVIVAGLWHSIVCDLSCYFPQCFSTKDLPTRTYILAEKHELATAHLHDVM